MSNNENNQQSTIKLIQDYNDNSLPHDEEAEEILLGSLLSDNNSLDLLENGLSSTHFSFQFMGGFTKVFVS